MTTQSCNGDAENSDEITPALTVRGLTKTFGGIVALESVDLKIAPGNVLGIVGPNGSGKTTLLNCISGIYHPTAGEIRLGSELLTGRPAHDIAALGIARTFQHVEIPRNLRVIDVVLLGRHCSMSKYGTSSYGLGIAYARGFERLNRGYAESALEQVGLHHIMNRTVGDLPYGLAKRVDLARALASEPSILLLDEPAAGINQEERHQLADLVSGLSQSELTVLLIEHDMTFVARVCNRLVLLVEGHQVYEGAVSDAVSNDLMIKSFLGAISTTDGY